jgi:hypothetical protein
VEDVRATGEIEPRRPDLRGEYYRRSHSMLGDTETAYTSWSESGSTAVLFAEATSDQEELSGKIVVFRVRVDHLEESKVFEGRADEDEYLIEGTVENVELLSDDETLDVEL